MLPCKKNWLHCTLCQIAFGWHAIELDHSASLLPFHFPKNSIGPKLQEIVALQQNDMQTIFLLSVIEVFYLPVLFDKCFYSILNIRTRIKWEAIKVVKSELGTLKGPSPIVHWLLQ